MTWETYWRSGESTGLPPMWPGFDTRIGRHMWVEFVGSLLCSERFFSGYPGFLLSPKTNIWFDLIWSCWFDFLSPQLVEPLCSAKYIWDLNKVIIIVIIMISWPSVECIGHEMRSLMQNNCAVLITKHQSLSVSAFSCILIGYLFTELLSSSIEQFPKRDASEAAIRKIHVYPFFFTDCFDFKALGYDFWLRNFHRLLSVLVRSWVNCAFAFSCEVLILVCKICGRCVLLSLLGEKFS